MKSYFTLLSFIAVLSLNAQNKLKSPEDFLGYGQGKHYTSHQNVLEYFRHVDEVMPNVQVRSYGNTYEGRELVYAIVTSPDNFKNLESIRLDNLIRSGIEKGTPNNKTAIVWLSYNVHGNEASSTETSMLTLHSLANVENSAIQEWLKNVVVIIDPCLNPDGRERFVNFYTQYGNKPFNTNGDALEHHEPWPSGRPNHYLFDLNRDWAWLTQQETQARINIYNQWMPHVHVDFHEQGQNSPYYFAPAAEPFHEVISPWQREFQTQIGKNNAKYFDEQGWLYFTKEVYDLYYPSYGDTYPTYNGAIGLTYEQAGLGLGLGVATDAGSKLTLEDRIAHHNTTALSTIEITAKNSAKVVDEFEKYFKENQLNPAATYKTYVIKGNNNPDKLNQITTWFDNQGIQYGHPAAAKTTKGFDYQVQAVSQANITTDDIVISIHQPKSRFITTVFEPFSKLPDSLTYDITAWNLMYAYDLKGYALSERINPAKPFAKKTNEYASITAKPYAYIFRYAHVKDAQFLAALLKENFKIRCSEKAFSLGNETFQPGTLIVTRANNEHILFFDSLIIKLAKQSDRKIFTTSTGFVEKGKDFGSSDLNLLKTPVVGLIFGEDTSPLSAGEVWHFFEQQLNYPVTQLGTDYFKYTDLNKYNVLIVPDGYYRMFDDSLLEKISAWVNAGGRLVLISHAINAFSDRNIFSIKRYFSDDEKNEADKRNKDREEKEGLPRYEDTERKTVAETISGAIYKVTVDNSHPLAFGLGNTYFTLKTSENRFAYLSTGWNTGVIKDNPKPVQGFAGFQANQSLKKSLVFGVQNSGQGEIVYLVDNPLFRSFWENGKLLFANAVFMVGQ
jgi:hypothetical protein